MRSNLSICKLLIKNSKLKKCELDISFLKIIQNCGLNYLSIGINDCLG